LGLSLATATAQEAPWRPVVAMQAPVASRTPAVALGRPVPLDAPQRVESTRSMPTEVAILPVAYLEAPAPSPQPIIRAQRPDIGGPTLVPPTAGGSRIAPVAPAERYNCGMVTQNPGADYSFLEAPRRWLHSIPGLGGCEGRHCFESDHAFDGFISPVTN